MYTAFGSQGQGNAICIYKAHCSTPLLLHLKGKMLAREWEGWGDAWVRRSVLTTGSIWWWWSCYRLKTVSVKAVPTPQYDKWLASFPHWTKFCCTLHATKSGWRWGQGDGRWAMAPYYCHLDPLCGGVAILSRMVEMQGSSREEVGAEVMCTHWRCWGGEGFLDAGGAIVCQTTQQAPQFHLLNQCFVVASILQEHLQIQRFEVQEVASTPEWGRVPASRGECWQQLVAPCILAILVKMFCLLICDLVNNR